MQEPTHKKERAIVLGATGNWAFAVANVLIGIKKYSPQLIGNTDFIVLEQEISTKDKELLDSIIPCKFIAYRFPSDELEKRNPNNYKRFSEMTYSRYECFKMLDEYKKVIWLDVDILIQGDISGMFDYGDNTGIAFCWEADSIRWLFTKEWERLEKYDLDRPNFNAGIFIISDRLKDYNKISEWCYEKTIEFCDILFLVDQSVLNLMIQEFNLEIESLDYKYNCSRPYRTKKELNQSALIHTCDYRKYWNYWDSSEWNQNNKQWVKMGGAPYSGKRINKILEYLYKKIYCPIAHNRPDPIRHPGKFIRSLLAGSK